MHDVYVLECRVHLTEALSLGSLPMLVVSTECCVCCFQVESQTPLQINMIGLNISVSCADYTEGHTILPHCLLQHSPTLCCCK